MSAANDEAPVVRGSEKHTQDSTIIGDNAELRKPLARLKAIAALSGVSVFDLSDGSLLVTKWGLTRAVPDVCALAQFLRQIGVAA